MTIRIKLGKHWSIGRTGLRFHLNTRHLQGSAGASGLRLFGRLGPLYGLWSKR